MKHGLFITFVFAVLLIAKSVCGQGSESGPVIVVPAPNPKIMDPNINRPYDGKGETRVLSEEELMGNLLQNQNDPEAVKKTNIV